MEKTLCVDYKELEKMICDHSLEKIEKIREICNMISPEKLTVYENIDLFGEKHNMIKSILEILKYVIKDDHSLRGVMGILGDSCDWIIYHKYK